MRWSKHSDRTDLTHSQRWHWLGVASHNLVRGSRIAGGSPGGDRLLKIFTFWSGLLQCFGSFVADDQCNRRKEKCLVPQEGAPPLGGRITPSRHVTGHCGLRDNQSKFQQLAMNPWS